MTRIKLTGVPETMLWTLHNRAAEAAKPNGFLKDPDCVRIYQSIDYDFVGSFGPPDGSHPLRSKLFDHVVVPWCAAHPGGTVVELGAGLETQFQRVDDGRVRWLCVDVPEAIEVRERFLPPTDRCRSVKKSALDLTWLDEVDPASPTFVSAQGLLMYFQPDEVRHLFTTIVERLPGVELLFDTIPHWFSRKTLAGYQKTPGYRAPPMPWAVNPNELAPLLRSWNERVTEVTTGGSGYPRTLSGLTLRLFAALPMLRALTPTIAHVRTRS